MELDTPFDCNSRSGYYGSASLSGAPLLTNVEILDEQSGCNGKEDTMTLCSSSSRSFKIVLRSSISICHLDLYRIRNDTNLLYRRRGRLTLSNRVLLKSLTSILFSSLQQGILLTPIFLSSYNHSK